MSVTTEEKKIFELEVSHLEVILLVLVAFVESFHINKVVMWFINNIVTIVSFIGKVISVYTCINIIVGTA